MHKQSPVTSAISHSRLSQPIYDIEKSYAENIARGPIFKGPYPNRKWPEENQWIDFLGYRIASPLGVPAGPLLSSQWTTLAARLGFDVVTYKTIRSRNYAGHPVPNVIFVKPAAQGANTVLKSNEVPREMCDLSITNSFGMPSMPPLFLQNDIARARDELHRGQVLIVSVVGSPGFSKDLTEDFVITAQMAKDAGAQVIEANFSCPNVSSKEGCLYADPENSYHIASAIAKAIAPTPLLIKVGKYSDISLFRKVATALARANVRGICGINSVSMSVVDDKGKPALGIGRETSGICGEVIRPAAIEFLTQAHRMIAQEKLDLELVGCGGITEPHHFDEFLGAGARVAMSATGMMWNPYLAAQWHQEERRRPFA